MLRRFIPLAVVVTVVVGGLRWLATDRGLVSEGVGVAIMMVLAVGLFSALAFWSASRLRRAEFEGETRRNELYRRVAANLTNGGVFLYDRDLRYVLAASANFRTIGLKPSDLEGKTIWEALDPASAAAVEPAYRAALAGERSFFEMDFRENAYLVTVAPTYDDEGEIVGGLVTTQTITDRKELEQQLLQSQKLEAVGLLAGGIAHDFNNLLTVISGYTSLALSSLRDAEAREGLEQISLAATRAAALTHQLLAFSRRQVLDPKPIRLNDVVAQAMPMLRALVEERIHFDVRLASDLPASVVDHHRLEQVLVNLVINARDAISGVGTIVIETSETVLDAEYVELHPGAKTGAHVVLAVTDNGTGMDEATRRRIFEPFYTTKPVGRGTGLGLSTAHGIVKQSGGWISVYSEPGHGTTFKLYLPVAPSHSPAGVPEPPAPRAVAGGTVLLVEDDHAVRMLTARLLTNAGYGVRAAASVDEALSILATAEIDVVVSDLVMPGGDGQDIADRPDVRGVLPPVVYMSGYTEASLSRAELLAGGARFVEKPFTAAVLLGAVGQAVAAGPRATTRI